MLRGFYTAASGMLAQQRRTEILTNNLANVNTPGFKSDQSSVRAFPEMLIQRLESEKIAPTKNTSISTSTLVGPINTGVYIQDVTPNFNQGDLGQTNLNTDIALQNTLIPGNGSVFFTIENPEEGVYYTRNGNFTLDAAGFLTTASGNYVLDVNGNRIQLENDQFTISDDGWLQANGQPVTQLGIAYADNPYQLVKGDNGFYSTADGAALPSAYGVEGIAFATKQGYIERSNVDANQAMTELLAAYRSFEANQKVLQTYDQSMDKAVNEIGRL